MYCSATWFEPFHYYRTLSFREMRERMNYEHERKDKEAFNKSGLQQKGGCEEGRAHS